MNVTSTTTTTLQNLLRQLEPAAAPAARANSQQVQKAEAGHPQVTPNGKQEFNPNSPRGTYLNIVV